ncbi:unnamed protein product [Brassica oleracea var. botrytis]|uniref:Transmembrane protein n=1 Tax=Brassica oleracea TaxID=3712 RepID=A0A3P6DM17_BRAOL|nr:unnamed protein product [Brassica oleracea]
MITRSKLAEQLREYQIKSKHDWASVSIFSSSSNFSSSSSSSRLESCVRLPLIIWTMVLCIIQLIILILLFFFFNCGTYLIIQGGCGSLCYLGTGDLSVPGVFSCLIVLQAVGTRVHLALCLLTIVRLYENHKASENS